MRATDCPTVPKPSRATRELSDPTLELSSARPQRSGLSADTGTTLRSPRVVPGQSWKTQKRTTAALYPVAIARFLRSSLVGLQFHFVPGGKGPLLLISWCVRHQRLGFPRRLLHHFLLVHDVLQSDATSRPRSRVPEKQKGHLPLRVMALLESRVVRFRLHHPVDDLGVGSST